MSIEDLERAGVLLPRERWGEREIASSFRLPWFIAGGAVAVFSVALMYWGEGGAASWVGAGMYLAGLVVFSVLAFRAVKRQRPGRRPRRRERAQRA